MNMSMKEEITVDQLSRTKFETISDFGDSEVYSEEGNWDDWEASEAEHYDIKCLFCTCEFNAVGELFYHCKAEHQFDFMYIRLSLKLDFYACVRLINYIRLQVQTNHATINELKLIGDEKFLTDDQYLKPVIEEDPLLFAFEDLMEGSISSFSRKSSRSEQAAINNENLIYQLKSSKTKLKTTENQLNAITQQFQEYRNMVRQSFYEPLLDNTIDSNSTTKLNQAEKSNDDHSVTSDVDSDSDYYFSSYGHIDIHEQMLKDKVRTDSYHDFIDKNKLFFKDKVVLDVGCGTGILSMFAAKAGASHVYAVDNSSIIEKARIIAQTNRLDQSITFIRGKIEEIQLPVAKVDIIISEWMGYFLLFEAMLDSVLYARDQFLKPNGLLCPNYSQILIGGFESAQLINEKVDFWNDVYGFNMSMMKNEVYREPLIDTISSSSIITSLSSIKEMNLQEIKADELEFQQGFTLTVNCSNEPKNHRYIHGLVGFFDILFTTGHELMLDWSQAAECGLSPNVVVPSLNSSTKEKEKTNEILCETENNDLSEYFNKLIIEGQGNPIAFSTRPNPPESSTIRNHTNHNNNHWKQTLFLFKEAIQVKHQERLIGTFYCNKNPRNPRELKIRIHLCAIIDPNGNRRLFANDDDKKSSYIAYEYLLA